MMVLVEYVNVKGMITVTDQATTRKQLAQVRRSRTAARRALSNARAAVHACQQQIAVLDREEARLLSELGFCAPAGENESVRP